MSAAAVSCGPAPPPPAGLLIGFRLPECRAQTAARRSKLNAFVHVGPDDTVTLFIHKAEMGQGTVTSLSMLLAEELECDWKKIRTEFPGVDPRVRRDAGRRRQPEHPHVLETLLRRPAPPRARCWSQAAAQKWGVDQSQCRAENSSVVNTATNARLELRQPGRGRSQTAPPAERHAEGRRAVPADRQAAQAPGHAGEGQRHAPVSASTCGCPGCCTPSSRAARSSAARSASFDAAKAKAVPGVKNVVQISNGVAVVADNTWSRHAGPQGARDPVGRGRECRA